MCKYDWLFYIAASRTQLLYIRSLIEGITSKEASATSGVPQSAVATAIPEILQ